MPGKLQFPRQSDFDSRQIAAVFSDGPLMYATAGYLGHMWELYAMWTWLLAFNRAALEAQGTYPKAYPPC